MLGAVVAVVLVLASGGLMVATGSLVADGDPAWGPVSLAAGVVAQAGFLIGRRAEPPRAPSERRRLRWLPLVGAIALSFVAGGFMFAAGYVAEKGYWYAWPFIAGLAAPTILGSYLMDRRARGR
jgi:hypothetical protein